MIDISRQCGLDIKLDDESYKFIMAPSLLGGETDTRKLEELRDVLYEKDISEPKKLYTLFNDMGEPETRKFLSRHGLRYDLGIMPPIKIGCEYIKTIGHYHGVGVANKIPFAEVYEVVHGTAHFVLQKQDIRNDKVLSDIFWVEASEGDRLIMPPEYAHVTINPGPEVLVLSNLAATACRLSYERIVRMGGMGYFNIEENGKSVFVENSNHESLSPIRKVSLDKFENFDIDASKAIYLTAKSNPEKFRFITEPQGFERIFNEIVQ